MEPQFPALNKGQTGSVVVRIEGAANVYGVQIDLTFDASQIKVLDADENRPGVQILAGDFLTVDEGIEVANEVDNQTGGLIYAYSRLAPAEPVSGSGTLFEFEVEALESGHVDLLLGPVIVASPEGDELPVRVADTTEDDGVLFVPRVSATAPAQATAVSVTDTPASSTPTTAVSGPATSTAEPSRVDSATATGPAAENSVSPSATQAAGVAPVTSGELATSTLPAPPADSEPEPAATSSGTAETAGADPTAAEIAAVPPAAEQENALPEEEQATPALTVIGQNVNLDENQAQAAAPEPTVNNAGPIEGITLAIGLIALSVALIAVWFYWHFRLR